MTIEAYYDGNAIKPLSPFELDKNQRVFIFVPDNTNGNALNDSMEALRGLEKFWGCLPDNFDAGEELNLAREEKYGSSA